MSKLGSKTEDNARSDVSGRSIFSSHELTFFDVRISHPNSQSSVIRTHNQIKHLQEVERFTRRMREKMKAYNDRIIRSSRCSIFDLIKLYNNYCDAPLKCFEELTRR